MNTLKLILFKNDYFIQIIIYAATLFFITNMNYKIIPQVVEKSDK